MFVVQLLTEGIPLKPVMVWIHGGAFVFGSGSSAFFGPDYLIEEDVILVSINYRLGSLGEETFNIDRNRYGISLVFANITQIC